MQRSKLMTTDTVVSSQALAPVRPSGRGPTVAQRIAAAAGTAAILTVCGYVWGVSTLAAFREPSLVLMLPTSMIAVLSGLFGLGVLGHIGEVYDALLGPGD